VNDGALTALRLYQHLEHRMHIGEALDALFAEFAHNHAVTIYGNPSPQLVAAANYMKDVSIKWYFFLKGVLCQVGGRPS
jgi:hypothetical protein